jgi:hypothetical protein
MAADGVDDLGPLAHQKIASAEHHHQAGRLGREERQQPTSAELLAEHDSAGRIRSVRLEAGLGDV